MYNLIIYYVVDNILFKFFIQLVNISLIQLVGCNAFIINYLSIYLLALARSFRTSKRINDNCIKQPTVQQLLVFSRSTLYRPVAVSGHVTRPASN